MNIKGRIPLRKTPFIQPVNRNIFSLLAFASRKMDTLSDLNKTHFPNSQPSGNLASLVYGYREHGFELALIAILVTAVFFSGFKSGRTIFRHILWFLDGLLGGAPHTVSLPGPSGLPIVGSLLDVSLNAASG